MGRALPALPLGLRRPRGPATSAPTVPSAATFTFTFAPCVATATTVATTNHLHPHPRLPLAFHPGESWRYSYATDVLGRLLEVLSGKPLDLLMDETLFAPLNMRDSSFAVTPDQRPRFAPVYEATEAPGVAVSAVARDRRRFERHSAHPARDRGGDRGGDRRRTSAALLRSLQRDEYTSGGAAEGGDGGGGGGGDVAPGISVAVVSCAARPGERACR